MVLLLKKLLGIISVILLVCLIYCLIFWKWIRRPYRFEIYVGKPRSGKTTLMTKFNILNQKHKKIVYSNIKMDVPNTRVFNAADIRLGNYFEPDSLVLIDEPNLYWDNRTFKDAGRKQTIEWFRLYGHNRVNIKMFTQTFDIDKKLRYLASDIYLIQKIAGTISICRRLKKNITIKESAMDAESQIVDELKFVPIFYPGSFKITFIPKWTKYFDSYSLPEGEQIKYSTIEKGHSGNYGKLNKGKLLDIFSFRRQHKKESSLDQ